MKTCKAKLHTRYCFIIMAYQYSQRNNSTKTASKDWNNY